MFKSADSQLTRSTELIKRIHTNLTGPMEIRSKGGHYFTCVFTCDYSSHVWVNFLKSKDQTFGVFKKFVTDVEKLLGLKIKFFHLD